MRISRGAIYRRALVISIMALLLFPMLGKNNQHYSIQERTPAIAQPSQFWNGFIKREWQPFLEQRFLIHIKNLRSYLILSYNETKLRLFSTRPNEHYIGTTELGYYPTDTIRRLNYDVLHKNDIEQHYQQAAHRLRILQELLGHHDVSLLVVPPPPKVRVYPEYVAPYLVAPTETIMRKAISYGDVLEENGVNTLNVQRIFAQKKASSPWPFFTTTSFHWSYWAGCTISDEIMREAETLTGKLFFKIGCSDVEYTKAKWADTDIASILNILSTDAIIGQAPFPKILPQPTPSGEGRKILIIGDSFSDQIAYALTQALPENSWSPSWLIRYDSFVTRQSIGLGGRITAQHPLQRNTALNEILTKDLLVLEISDGNVYRQSNLLNRMEFSATQTLLESFLQKGMIDPSNFLTTGWHSSDKKQWHTTGSSASFVIPSVKNGNSVQLALDVENNGNPHLVDILLDGKRTTQITLPQGHGIFNLTLPISAPAKDSLLTEVSLQDPSGKPLAILLRALHINGESKDKAEVNNVAQLPKIDRANARSINLISNEEPEDVLVEGLSGLESNDKESWRWATGSATRIKFYVAPGLPEQDRQRLLKFSFKNGASIPEQAVTVRLNGKDIYHFSAKEVASRPQIDADVALAAKQGINVLEFIYQDWNHGKKDYSPDSRQLAIVIMNLSLNAYPVQMKFPKMRY